MILSNGFVAFVVHSLSCIEHENDSYSSRNLRRLLYYLVREVQTQESNRSYQQTCESTTWWIESQTHRSFPLSCYCMKYIVDLYVGGKVFKEEVQANSPKDARETAQVRNPTAKIIGVNVSFK